MLEIEYHEWSKFCKLLSQQTEAGPVQVFPFYENKSFPKGYQIVTITSMLYSFKYYLVNLKPQLSSTSYARDKMGWIKILCPQGTVTDDEYHVHRQLTTQGVIMKVGGKETWVNEEWTDSLGKNYSQQNPEIEISIALWSPPRDLLFWTGHVTLWMSLKITVSTATFFFFPLMYVFLSLAIFGTLKEFTLIS